MIQPTPIPSSVGVAYGFDFKIAVPPARARDWPCRSELVITHPAVMVPACHMELRMSDAIHPEGSFTGKYATMPASDRLLMALAAVGAVTVKIAALRMQPYEPVPIRAEATSLEIEESYRFGLCYVSTLLEEIAALLEPLSKAMKDERFAAFVDRARREAEDLSYADSCSERGFIARSHLVPAVVARIDDWLKVEPMHYLLSAVQSPSQSEAQSAQAPDWITGLLAQIPEGPRRVAEAIVKRNGITRAEVAADLNLSEDTVKKHLKTLDAWGFRTRGRRPGYFPPTAGPDAHEAS